MSTRYLLLVGFTLMLSTGQMLFKIAADSGSGKPLPYAFMNVWLVAAVALYGFATLLWVYILRVTPLSVAYPFTALSFIIVPIAASAFFGEVLSWRYAAGMALIISGILLTTR